MRRDIIIGSKPDARGERIVRYRVDFHRWQPRYAEILVFGFMPIRARVWKVWTSITVTTSTPITQEN